jgi:phosphate starvation-inducible protein PhoH
MALAFMKENKISKIILTRPAVEAGEKLGYLPGTIAEKVDPTFVPFTMHCMIWWGTIKPPTCWKRTL